VRPAAQQNVLEFWRRNCNKREIAEGSKSLPTLPPRMREPVMLD
jgi:hypothetical protein